MHPQELYTRILCQRTTPMRRLFLSVLLLSAAIATTQNAVAQSCSSHLQTTLQRIGLADSHFWTDSTHTFISYENRAFRSELTAIKRILEVLRECPSNVPNVILLPHHRGLPIGATTLTSPFDQAEFSSSQRFKSSSITFELASFDHHPRLHFPHFTLTFYPDFMVQFGDYETTTESQINLVPELAATIWPGMRLSAQLILPLHNELTYEGDYIRPGRLVFNQVARFKTTTWASASIGYFSENRYGLDLSVRRFDKTATWSIGADFAYTGYASFRKGTWYYSDLNDKLLLGILSYRLAPMDLHLEAAYGRFLYDDIGWRITMSRYWNDVSISLMALKTGIGLNGGFRFTIPLFPARSPQIGPLVLRPAPYIGWTYRYRGFPRGGRQHLTGYDLDHYFHFLSKTYLNSQLSNYLFPSKNP